MLLGFVFLFLLGAVFNGTIDVNLGKMDNAPNFIYYRMCSETCQVFKIDTIQKDVIH